MIVGHFELVEKTFRKIEHKVKMDEILDKFIVNMSFLTNRFNMTVSISLLSYPDIRYLLQIHKKAINISVDKSELDKLDDFFHLAQYQKFLHEIKTMHEGENSVAVTDKLDFYVPKSKLLKEFNDEFQAHFDNDSRISCILQKYCDHHLSLHILAPSVDNLPFFKNYVNQYLDKINSITFFNIQEKVIPDLSHVLNSLSFSNKLSLSFKKCQRDIMYQICSHIKPAVKLVYTGILMPDFVINLEFFANAHLLRGVEFVADSVTYYDCSLRY